MPEEGPQPDVLERRVTAALGDQYQLEGEIGRGGMSVVYRARDLRLGRTVAIKVLPPELAHDPAIRTRFAREAHTAAQLSHPHIVPIFDVGEREGIAYLVMAYVTGGSLAGLLAHQPRQPVDEARRLLVEIADALAFAHQRGVIHRDIKPDNILLDGDNGRAMVTDFGIARAMEAGTRLTVTGVAVGTPAYMSPEQAVGERGIDGRSDIYSLGVLAYQMLTGRVPFTAGNSMALLMKHVTEKPKPIADLRPETPRALREVVERALAKAPEDRWPTAGVMRDALRSDAPPAGWRPEPRRAEPVRYVSPRRGSRTVERESEGEAGPAAPAGRRGDIVMVPGHLEQLTPEQRFDLRLWHGRVNLFDRIKALRLYTWYTAVMIPSAFTAFGVGMSEGVPPAVLLPIIPWYMGLKWWRRSKSLKKAGVKLWRVLLMPRAKWVLPAPPPAPSRQQLEKLAPAATLDSPHGDAIRKAAEDRAAIVEIVGKLSKADRAMLPDVVPTANALVERVAHLAQALIRLEDSIDPRLMQDLEARISREQADESPEAQRRVALLKRQHGTLADLDRRRATLEAQLDNAGLALGSLRLDLIKVRSSGLQSAFTDVSTATQEARTLSRDIGAVLEAAEEVRGL